MTYVKITQSGAGYLTSESSNYGYQGLFTDGLETCITILLKGVNKVVLLHSTYTTDMNFLIEELEKIKNEGEVEWGMAANIAFIEKLSNRQKTEFHAKFEEINELINQISDANPNLFRPLQGHDSWHVMPCFKADLGFIAINHEGTINTQVRPLLEEMVEDQSSALREEINKVNNFFLDDGEYTLPDIQFNGETFLPLPPVKKTQEEIEALMQTPKFQNPSFKETISDAYNIYLRLSLPSTPPIGSSPYIEISENIQSIADNLNNEIDPLRIDPKRIVVVCIRGWGGISSSNVEEYEAEKRAIMAELAAAYHHSGLSMNAVNLEEEAEAYLNGGGVGGGGGRTGMETLRIRLYNELKKQGVPEKNVIYTDWDDDELEGTINRFNPLYLAIIGHSYGACKAARVSTKVKKVPNFVGLVDPVFRPAVFNSSCPVWKAIPTSHDQHDEDNPDNFPRGNRIISWYQDSDCPRGYHPVMIKEGKKERAVDNRHVAGVTHTTIDDHKPIHDVVFEIVTGGVKPSEVVSPIHENTETTKNAELIKQVIQESRETVPTSISNREGTQESNDDLYNQGTLASLQGIYQHSPSNNNNNTTEEAVKLNQQRDFSM